MSAKCYKCGGATQPAALNPKALWCTICAEELNQSGGPLTGASEPPRSGGPINVKGELPTFVTKGELAEVVAGPDPKIETFPHNMGDVLRQFRVTIGSVSFTAQGRTELSVGKSKVVIELL